MFTQWDELKKQYDLFNKELTNPNLETNRRNKLQKEAARLSNILEKHNEILEAKKELEQTQAQEAQNKDSDMIPLFKEEIATLQSNIVSLEKLLEDHMFPPDERDNRSVFLEIRAGTGGQEAALFASDLLKMYTNYALKKGWKVEIVSISQTDLKGYKEVVVHIQGKGVYGHLKFESGVHRVQRVPSTETSGRIHTSTATVAVLPEAQEIDVTINPQDLRIDTYRSGGAGGQHVNKTDSAVRITHIPTGVVVACQDDRSQHKNRAKAMKVLQSRIYERQQEKKDLELRKERKEQVGRGMRAEKARTYNFAQNRVSDHQVGLTINKLDRILEGELDEIIDALRSQDREDRLTQTFVLHV